MSGLGHPGAVVAPCRNHARTAHARLLNTAGPDLRMDRVAAFHWPVCVLVRSIAYASPIRGAFGTHRVVPRGNLLN